MKRLTFLAILVYIPVFVIYGRDYEIVFKQSDTPIYQLDFSLIDFQLSQVAADGFEYTKIDFDAQTRTEQKGYAQLPFIGVAVQIPAGRNVDLVIINQVYEEYQLDHPLLPSRGVLYRYQDPSQIPYQIDPQSITDSWYPEEIALHTLPYVIRNVRGTIVKFYPFQYNAKQNLLRVYQSLTVELIQNDLPAINPLLHDTRAILPEMDRLYQSVFINYQKESTTASEVALTINQTGDLLVITTARDEIAIEPYIQWKREKGFAVYKEVVERGMNPKNLIQQRYNENNNILYVLIAGDWEDIPCDLGTSANLPMDPQLGCVVGSDVFADICIGRFSAKSAADITTQVNKVITYEKNAESGGDWYSTATGIASDEGTGDDNEDDFEHIDAIWNDKLDPFTFDAYQAIYEPSATKTMINNALNSGTSLINYTGHGSATSWSTTGFNNDDVANLSNGQKLPWIISVACNNGEFNRSGDCFAEAWLKKQGGGAAGMLASSISQPWDPPMRGQDYFMDVLTGGYNYDAHPGQYGINTNEQRTTFGSIVFNGLTLMLTESYGSSDVETAQTWAIFGDPTMQVRTQPPMEINLTNETVIAGIDYTTTVTSIEGIEEAMVTLSQNDHYFSGITDAQGEVTIAHDLNPGSALLVVTAFNTQTIYQEIEVISAEGPYVLTDSCEIYDLEIGNGNGQADYSELTYLNVYAHNIGSAIAYGVSARLTTDDPHLMIQDSLHYYGEISSAEVLEGFQAFQVAFSDSVPDQYLATLQVHFTDDSLHSWTSNIPILVNAPSIRSAELILDDSVLGNNDAKLEEGETADLLIVSFNSGHAPAFEILFELTTLSPYLVVNAPVFMASTLFPGDSIQAEFNVTAAGDVPLGTVVETYLQITSGAYQAVDTFNIVLGEIPVYTMSNAAVYCNHGLFYDSGGPEGSYQSRERLTMTFYPEGGAPALKVIFNSFEVENNDLLYIYDGLNSNAPEVAGSPFSGSNIPDEIEATNPAGALTFYFSSNLLLNSAGWSAEIISTVVSGLDNSAKRFLTQFELFPNFPNPFNPSTTIQFQLPLQGKVSIEVYNMLGQKVVQLADEVRQPGVYRLTWDARDETGNELATGIYLLRMKSGPFVKTQKMLLIR